MAATASKLGSAPTSVATFPPERRSTVNAAFARRGAIHTPAITVDADGVSFSLECFANLFHILDGLANIGGASKKCLNPLFLLISVRGELLKRAWRMRVEEVRHNDLGLERVCEDVCSLQGLWPEAKDVEDGNEGAASALGTCDIDLFKISEGLERAF